MSILLGKIEAFHSFNGTIQIPRGYMQCNGDQINSTNYDAIHGAGAYSSDGIASLLLHNKYTPNLTGRYPVGAASTTQTGASAITAVGNASHQINIQHAHSHAHLWYTHINSSANNTDGAGDALTRVNADPSYSGMGITLNPKSDDITISGSKSTDTNAATALSTVQSIQPESIEVMYIIRVGL